MTLLNWRAEPRGLLDADKAKPARLGAAENEALAQRYNQEARRIAFVDLAGAVRLGSLA